jgi:hypothetical protein
VGESAGNRRLYPEMTQKNPTSDRKFEQKITKEAKSRKLLEAWAAVLAAFSRL